MVNAKIKRLRAKANIITEYDLRYQELMGMIRTLDNIRYDIIDSIETGHIIKP
jgi:hypothetical protein